MTFNDDKDRHLFESAMRSLEAEIANVGAHLTIDSASRLTYSRQIKAMSDEMRAEVMRGRMTWAQAAKQANETRNLIMDIIRHRSTPVGRAIAEKKKLHGKTLNELVAKKTLEVFGKDAQFNPLSTTQKNRVYAEIVKSAGVTNSDVSTKLHGLSHAGRGLVVLSLALSVYNIATAEDKASAAGKELALTGSGIGGGIAGGAIAGLACGPASPVCVTVGAFVGGALATFGISFIW